MAITAEEVLGYLGFEANEDTTLDQFKDWAGEKIIKADSAKDHKVVRGIVGKRIGTRETAIRSLYKEAGVEFPDGETEKIEDVAAYGIKSMASKIEKLTTDLEAAKAGNPDQGEALEAKIKEIADLERGWNDEKNKVVTMSAKIKELEGLNEKKAQEVESFIYESKLNDLKSQVGIPKEADKMKVAGFYSTLADKYKTTLSKTQKEDGSIDYGIDIRDMDGNQIPDPDKHGEVLGYVGVMKREAAKHNLLTVNKDGGKPISPQVQIVNNGSQSKQSGNQPNNGGRKIATGSQRLHRNGVA